MKPIISIVIAVAVRFLFSFDSVLNPIRFANHDSYYYARMVRDGGGGFYAGLLRGITNILPFNNELELMAIPLIMAALTVGTVYLIGSLIWGEKVGFIAALILAVFPGEYLGRTIYGNLDHHAFEVYITTTAVLCLILLLSSEEKIHRLWGIGGLVMSLSLYMLIWQGYLLFFGIFGLFAALILWLKFKAVWARVLIPIISGVIIVLAIGKMPLLGALTVQTTGEALPLLGHAPPLFSVVLVLLSIGVVSACAVDYYYAKDNRLLFMIIWTVVMIVATFIMRRFAYYLAVPTAILIGYTIWEWLDWTQVKKYAVAVSVAAIFAFMALYARSVPVPSDDWMQALEWIKGNTEEDAVITAWWDYGYWIEYETGRKAAANPSQDLKSVKYVAYIMTTESEWMVSLAIEYLILDSQTLKGKYPSVEKWAGRVGDDAAVKRIWNGDTRMVTVFESETVKIYK